jgi:DNA-binding beta-propeller fold protein YncE
MRNEAELRRRSPRLRWLVLLLATCLAGAASAHAQPFVYVTNVTSSTVSQYAVGAGGALSPLTPATVTTGVDPSAVAVTPDGKSAYVPNLASSLLSSTISQYDIDPLTGALSPKTPATVDGGHGAWLLAVTPDGKSTYVTEIANGSILQYTVDPGSGALSPKTPATVAAGGPTAFPFGIAVTPDGKSAYVPTFNAGVRQYNVDPLTGVLSAKTPPAVVAGDTPEGVAVTPDGKSAYVTNINSGTVSQYDINPVSGALSPKSPATVPTGAGPTNGVAVTPDGKSAYVYNSGIARGVFPPGNPTVSQYDINPVSGALTPKTPATVASRAGSTASGLAVSPDGTSAYVVNSSVVSQYTIDPVSGRLSPKTPPSVPTGGGSTGIAVASTPRVPTSKEQCKNGGWRDFPGFKSQGQCIAFVNRPTG